MDEITVKLNIFSPRWGHEDTYELIFSKHSLIITQGARSCKCSWIENLDPEWSGESLLRILNNDHIYPPANFQKLLEYAWVSWRNGELEDSDLDEELQVIAKWLNIITKSKPDTEFWKQYF